MKTNVLAGAILATLIFSYRADARPKYSYENTERTCSVEVGFPQLIKVKWEIKQKCTKTSAAVSAGPHALHAAVRAPDYYPLPQVRVTDLSGKPYLIDGEELVFVDSQRVTGKVAGSHPAPAGQKWFGLESANLIFPGEPTEGQCSVSGLSCFADEECGRGETCDAKTPETMDFIITYSWEFSEPVGETSGASWLSNDSDDLYGDLVIDDFAVLPELLFFADGVQPEDGSSLP